MPFYNPFTDAKTNGEATEGNRHVELHGPLCGTAEEVAREGGAVRRGTRGAERGAAKYSVELGGGQKVAIYRTIAATCGFSRGYSSNPDAPEINFWKFSKKYPIGYIPLLQNTQLGIIIPSVASNIQQPATRSHEATP